MYLYMYVCECTVNAYATPPSGSCVQLHDCARHMGNASVGVFTDCRVFRHGTCAKKAEGEKGDDLRICQWTLRWSTARDRLGGLAAAV